MGFGILVEGIRGGIFSPTSNINIFNSQKEKDHLIFLLKKIVFFFLRSLLFMPNKANAIHPYPTHHPAA